MKIDNTKVYGFEMAFKGMRNPMNSWHMSDSICDKDAVFYSEDDNVEGFCIGENDLKLAQSLIKSGGEHRKFLRQIQVWCDIDEPRYFWSEFDTYHFNTKNSCSTMHKLLNKQKPITLDMFVICDEDKDIADIVVKRLNEISQIWIDANDHKTKDYCVLRAKRLLMEGMLQLRTVNTNYEEIRNIWLQRINKPHRLKEEWVKTVGEWIKTLPYANKLILMDNK